MTPFLSVNFYSIVKEFSANEIVFYIAGKCPGPLPNLFPNFIDPPTLYES